MKLDLAREWFELVAYPFVWALFVTRRDGSRPDIIRSVRDAILNLEMRRGAWARDANLSKQEQELYETVLRYRFDDLAVASLTELCEYLFYYGVVSELPQFVLAADDEDTQGTQNDTG
jgi:predicted solute-binding protein